MFITRTKLSIFIIKVTINRVIKLIWWLKRERGRKRSRVIIPPTNNLKININP